MAGRQYEAAKGMVFTYQAGHGGCREQSVFSDDDLAKAVGRGHFHYGLDGNQIIVTAVAPQYQRSVMEVFKAVKNGLDKTFQVMGLLKNRDLLTQARCAGFLPLKGCCVDGEDIHIS